MEVVVWVLAFGGWPAVMVVGMFLTGDLELPTHVSGWLEERAWRNYERAQLVAERLPADADFSTGVLAADEGWVADLDLGLTGERWWRYGLRGDPTMLVVEQEDFVFGPHSARRDRACAAPLGRAAPGRPRACLPRRARPAGPVRRARRGPPARICANKDTYKSHRNKK